MPVDGIKVIGYRQALTLPKCPQSIIVAGSGAIGSELACFYNAMGCKVTLVEFMPNVLPVEDEEVSRQVARSMKKAGIEVMVKSSVEKVETARKGVKMKIKNKKSEIETHEAEIVFSAVGVSPNTENLGLQRQQVRLHRRRAPIDAEINQRRFPFPFDQE